MIPKIVHQAMLANFNQKPKDLTSEELRLCRRMRRVLPDWEFRFWNDESVLAMIQKWFPQYFDTFRGIRRGVIKADIARYIYLFAEGGFYFDLDYKMLRPIDDEILSYGLVLPMSRQTATSFRLGNAVMGAKPQHPFFEKFVTHIFSTVGLTELAESKVEEVTGPDGLTAFYEANKHLYDDIYLPARPIFHPVHTHAGFWSQTEPGTVGIHLSWGSWRTKNPIANVVRFSRRKLTSF